MTSQVYLLSVISTLVARHDSVCFAKTTKGSYILTCYTRYKFCGDYGSSITDEKSSQYRRGIVYKGVFDDSAGFTAW